MQQKVAQGRDPFADNTAPEAWAASDESGKSEWRTYSYRGIAQASAVGPDGQWREFVMGLLDAGEVWLDDLSVIESPNTTPVPLLQNGTFDTGLEKWRIIGNHHGEVIDDPGQPGNKVLRLVATGPTEHMSNHGETTLAGGRDVVNGREYQISFRAKWISGSRQFHTRLYFNRLARVTLLDAPDTHGTPGARNSTWIENLGPTYRELRHDPPVPGPFEPVEISVQASDPDGIEAMTLWWSIDGGEWSSTPMSLHSQTSIVHPFTFTAEIPGRSAGTIVQFYVEGTDALGATTTFPAGGRDSRALYKVDDGLAATNGLHNIRIVMLTADANFMHSTIHLMSNGRLGGTVIYNEREVIYDCGIRLKGSEHSRTTTPRLGFNVRFPGDRLFRGVHRTVALDRSESTGFGQREMLVHQTAIHAGGLPTKYHDLAHVIAPRLEHTGPVELQLARYSNVFLDSQFRNGSDGMLYEYELVYQLNATDNGTPEGNKIPAPDSVVGTTIRNLGNDKEHYRWTFLVKNNEERDDFSRIMEFSKAMESTGATFHNQIANYIDIDQWLRAFALCVLSGAGDNYGGDGALHNAQFYVRPEDDRVLFFPHDIDAFFNATRPIVPNSDLSKLISVPANARAYYGHLLDIIQTTYNAGYMTRWANHYGGLLPAQNFAGHLAFIVQRANFVAAQVNSAVPNVGFAITSNAGSDFSTTNSYYDLTGTAPLPVKSISVNGIAHPVTWTSTTAWRITVPLGQGTNTLTIAGLDLRGESVTNAVSTIAITNTGEGALLPVVINEWMAANSRPDGFSHPITGAFSDWFELFNPNSSAVNLGGYYLTDNLSQPAKWQVPSETIISPRGFLLVWADNQTNRNGLSPYGDLHAGFQLSRSGEAIGLFSPEGILQSSVTFGPQTANVSQGLYPDGNVTGDYQFMTNYTPRLPNSLAGALRITEFFAQASGVTLRWVSAPGRSYRVEYTETLSDPLWLPVASEILATESSAEMDGLEAAAGQRYYRVLLID